MANKEKINNKLYFQCEICKFYYGKKELAEKCQLWCKEHNNCKMEITKHAVNPKKNKSCC